MVLPSSPLWGSSERGKQSLSAYVVWVKDPCASFCGIKNSRQLFTGDLGVCSTGWVE